MNMKPIFKYLLALVAVVGLGSAGYNSLFKIEPAHVEGVNPKLDKIRLQPGFKIEHLISPSDENIGFSNRKIVTNAIGIAMSIIFFN